MPAIPAPPLSLIGRARPAPETSPWALPWSTPNHSLQNRMHFRYYGSNLGRFMKPDDNSAQRRKVLPRLKAGIFTPMFEETP